MADKDKDKGRFWGSDTESSSDDETTSSDEEEEMKEERVVVATNRWAAQVEDSESSDDESRVVKTLKDKRFEEINKVINAVHKVLKIKDWNNVVNTFQSLNQLLEKRAAHVVGQYGLPTSYIRLLVALQDEVKATTKAVIKGLSKTGAKSFQRLRQNLKKLTADKGYNPRIEAYRANPTADSDEDDDDAAKEDKGDKGGKQKVDKKKGSDSSSSDSDSSDSSDSDSSDSSDSSKSSDDSDSDSDSDSEMWDKSDSDSSDSSDEGDGATGTTKFTREFWLKKPKDIEKEKEKLRRVMAELEQVITSNPSSMVMTRVLKASRNFEVDIADLPFPPFMARLVPEDRETLLKTMKTITFLDSSRVSSFIPSRTGDDIPAPIYTELLKLIKNSKEVEVDEDGDQDEKDDDKPEYIEVSPEEKVKLLVRWCAQSQLYKDANKLMVQLQNEAAREATKKDTGAVKEKIKTYKFNNVEDYLAQVAKVNAKRGKKGFSFDSYCVSLRALASAATNFGLKYQIPALLQLVSVCFDLSRDRNTAIPAPVWRSSVQQLLTILRLLEENPKVALKRITTDSLMDDDEEEESKGGDLQANSSASADGEQVIRTHANFVSLAMQFQQDLTKALKLTNDRSDEYLSRVADETLLQQLFVEVHKYFEREAATIPKPSANADLSNEGALKAYEKALQAYQEVRENIAAVAQLQVEHIYYLHDKNARPMNALRSLQHRSNWDVLNNVHPGARGTKVSAKTAADDSIINPAAASSFDANDAAGEEFDSIVQMRRLCKIVYDYVGSGSARMRVRTVLCQIYHFAIHDRYSEAKMLLLMSRFQDQADDWDTETQVVYNRAMAQLGLAALRANQLTDALRCLSDLCSGSKINELLAQRTSRHWNHNDKFTKEEQAERELKERLRLLPFHRHINTDLLEACHNISAMLIEIPNLVAETNHQNLPSSYEPATKIFRRSLEKYELLVFDGPPENNRERVVLAAQYLSRGDWRSCRDLVFNLKCWQLWHQYDVAAIHAELLRRMKEVALRTYLLKFHTHYASLGVESLCGMFELPVEAAHNVLNKMIIAKEFMGSWQNVLDGTPEQKQAVHIYHVEPTPLQRLAISFADKATQFGRNNVNLTNGTADGNFEIRKGDRRYDNRSWGRGRGRGRGRARGRGRGGRGGRGFRNRGRDLVQAPGRMQIRWR